MDAELQMDGRTDGGPDGRTDHIQYTYLCKSNISMMGG